MNFVWFVMDSYDKFGQMILAYKIRVMDSLSVNSAPLIGY
jgi:hypothetical protein